MMNLKNSLRLVLVFIGCVCSAALRAGPITVSVLSADNAWPGRPSYVTAGGNVTLRVTEQAPTTQGALQWYFNGAPVAGATSAQLALSSVASPHVGNYFVRSTADGVVTESNWFTLNVVARPTNSSVDPSFVSALYPASDAVYYDSIMPLRDGGYIVGRINFNSTGVPHSSYRLRADGSVAPAAPSLPTSPRKVVTALADGTLLMNLPPYRMSTDDSTVTGFTSIAGLNAATELTTGALQPDGKLIVGYGANLLRVNADGSRDTTFAYTPIAALPVVYTIEFDSAGRALVLGGVPDTGPDQLVRLTPTGARDATFAAITLPSASTRTVMADDGLLISTTAGYTRYNANGIATETWNLSTLRAGADAMAIAPSGDIYLGYSSVGIVRLRGGPTPQVDPTFFAAANEATKITALTFQPDGKLLVAGVFMSWEGHATNSIVRLDTMHTPSLTAPVIASRGINRSIFGGTPLTATMSVLGTGPLSYTWVAVDGGKLPDDTTSAALTFPSFQKENLGRYQLRVTGAGGTTLGPVIELLASTTPRLRNVSSRSQVGGGEEALIAGLTLELNSTFRTRRMLLRGAGPALAQFGVQSPLANPVLTFHRADGTQVQRNDDWVDDSFARNWVGRAGAFPFASGSADSQIIYDTGGGSFTLQLRDADGRTGVGLIESYDVGDDTTITGSAYGELTNLSLRGKVGSGDASLIAGFIIDDPQNLGRSLRVLVRGVGPTLAQYSVTAPLPNPRLTLYNGASVAFANNDDWSTATNAAEIAAVGARVGAFALSTGSKDSAVLMELPPGGYTAIVNDASGATGIALIEFYRAK